MPPSDPDESVGPHVGRSHHALPKEALHARDEDASDPAMRRPAGTQLGRRLIVKVVEEDVKRGVAVAEVREAGE
eukprot:867330-Prymnesium_polylepis.1